MKAIDKYKVPINNENNDKIEFVSAVITNKEGKVLIVKRRDNLRIDPGKYDNCSGHMKIGEVPTQSMLRELREEIGIEQKDIKLIKDIGIIKLNHKLFPNSKCHIYDVVIDLSEKEINKRILNSESQEMEYSKYLNDIEEFRQLFINTDEMRLGYDDEIEKVFQIIEKRINIEKDCIEQEENII